MKRKNAAGRAVGVRRVAHVAHNPVAQVRAGHNSRDLLVLVRSLTFICGEEKDAILPHRSTDGCSERVADEMRWHVWKTCLDLGSLIKPIIRLAYLGAVVLVSRSVEGIRPTLGYQTHLRPGGASSVSIGITRRDPEFLKRV